MSRDSTNQTRASDKKKGTVRLNLDPEEEKNLQNYKPIKDELLNWEQIKNQDNFNVKQYKDSIYRGELEEKANKR